MCACGRRYSQRTGDLAPVGAAVCVVGAGGISVTQGRTCHPAPQCRGCSVTAIRFCSVDGHVLTPRAPSWHRLSAGPRSPVWPGPQAGLSARLRLQELVQSGREAARGLPGGRRAGPKGCPLAAPARVTGAAACSTGCCIAASGEPGRCFAPWHRGWPCRPCLCLKPSGSPCCLLIPVC